MDFSNEPYVRLYTRNTTTWKRLPWQARCIWPLILRVVDRAGILPLDGMTPAEAVALHIEMPLEIVEVGVGALLARMNPADPNSTVLKLTESGLLAPKFIEANEAIKSDKQRQRDSRARRRDIAASRVSDSKDNVHSSEVSRGVTNGHAVTPSVTLNLTSTDPILDPVVAQVAATTSAVTTTAPPPPPPNQPLARAIPTPFSKGARWWEKNFSTRRLKGNLAGYKQSLEWIGSQIPEEMATVAQNVLASVYLASEDGRHNLNPDFISKNWGKYLVGTNDFGAKSPAKVQPLPPELARTYVELEAERLRNDAAACAESPAAQFAKVFGDDKHAVAS